MDFTEWKDFYMENRPIEPYSESDNAEQWACIAYYAEDKLQEAFNAGRKAVNKNYSAAFEQVRIYIEAKARSANFFQRFRIAIRFLFKKDFNVFL